MNKYYKNIIIGVIIFVAMFLLIGASYAFFTARIIGNEDVELMKLDSGTIELTFVDSNTINLSNAKPGDSESKTFTVENTGTFDDDYTYNIKLVDVDTSFLEEDLEYTLQEYTDDNYTDLKEGEVNKTGFINEETLNENNEMYLAVNIGRPEKNIKHYYKLTITFKELEGVNQNYNQGAIFNGKINVDDNKGAELYKKTYTITTSITNGNIEPSTMKVKEGEDSDTFTINPNEGYRVKSITCDNGQQVGKKDNTFKVKSVTSDSECMITLTNEPISFSEIIIADNVNIFEDDYENIRYAGPSEEVNNYIWFNCNDYSVEMDETNCEKWRIIGLFKNVPKSGGEREDLVKIIRSENVGDIAWDSARKNNWANASLRVSLTSYYNGSKLNSKKGITPLTKDMIEQVSWNIGGTLNLQTSTALDFYTAEREGAVPSGATSTWNGYIGLMYPSDYGYATTGGAMGRTLCLAGYLFNWNEDSYKTDCAENDWLWFSSEFQWILTPAPSFTDTVHYIVSDGHVGYGIPTPAHAVHPALYLKSSVKVKSGAGDGSVGTPYILVP